MVQRSSSAGGGWIGVPLPIPWFRRARVAWGRQPEAPADSERTPSPPPRVSSLTDSVVSWQSGPPAPERSQSARPRGVAERTRACKDGAAPFGRPFARGSRAADRLLRRSIEFVFGAPKISTSIIVNRAPPPRSARDSPRTAGPRGRAGLRRRPGPDRGISEIERDNRRPANRPAPRAMGKGPAPGQSSEGEEHCFPPRGVDAEELVHHGHEIAGSDVARSEGDAGLASLGPRWNVDFNRSRRSRACGCGTPPGEVVLQSGFPPVVAIFVGSAVRTSSVLALVPWAVPRPSRGDCHGVNPRCREYPPRAFSRS